jgi:hypothetical protein
MKVECVRSRVTSLRLAGVIVCFVAATIVAAGLVTASAAAGTVRVLVLPAGFTVAPEADRRLMTIGADGVVYAIAGRIEAPERTRAVRWRAGEGPDLFVPIPQENDHFGSFMAPRIDAVAPTRNQTYVTVSRTHDGAYIGTRFNLDRWVGGATRAWTVPECVKLGYDGPHVYAVDRERMALTIDPSSDATGIDLSEPASVEANLPQAVLVEGDRCTSLGVAILTGLRGRSAIGYVGHLDGKPAPWFVNLIVQKMTATRWLDARPRALGPGVPFATTSAGVVVGASALPGHATETITTNFFGRAGTYVFPTPHAVLWSREGKHIALVHGDARSIAWDINEAGTTVGMLQKPDGRHYAFRHNHGRVELLDDLPHPPGWRFESAYAVTEDGTIAGTGTYHGTATAYLWHPN